MIKFLVKLDKKMKFVASTIFFVSVFEGIIVSSIGIIVCSAPILLCICRMLGVAKTLCCAMGWHCPNNQLENVRHSPNDPLHFLIYAKCSWCGYEGQIDSQGNLF